VREEITRGAALMKILLGIFGGSVPPGSENPDPFSD